MRIENKMPHLTPAKEKLLQELRDFPYCPLHSRYRDHNLIDMVCQDSIIAFLAYYSHLLTSKTMDQARAVIVRIGFNNLNKELRKRAKDEIQFVGDDEFKYGVLQDHAACIEDIIDVEFNEFKKAEQQAKIDMALESLSADTLFIIVMRVFQKLRFKEIALKLDISEQSARKRFFDARKKLRNALAHLK